ncbi:Dabb family protein [Niallia endozanthoxylica]|uniref:Dabb family protein n=1 Tax=Niallia endozanthoxylica TaxID=2036016 RepID=A0A5J5I4C6_9BACI|nr:Dabb family protein [Niallia endozanthoxylica]KAA9028504.1 Dabb family protein [Niallia endozanthoxylica]
MIEHIVLIKFKNELTDDQLNGLIQQTLSLKDYIPGIIDIQQGRNFSNRSKGYEIALTARFTDHEALENYLPHPKHQELLKSLTELGLEDTIVVDFEI